MQTVRAMTATCLFSCIVLLNSSVTQAATIVFINRCAEGCQFTAGFDNAVTNTSSIIPSTRNLSAFAAGDATFNAVTACLTEILAPFDIVLTTSDPSPLHHSEMVLAGTPAELLFPSGVRGVAPSNCSLISNAPAFVFANSMGSDAEEMCNVTASQLGAMGGLEPLFNCQDVMSYLPSCGSKSFRNEDSLCGTFEASDCFCGGSTRNSFSTMRSVFGVADPVFSNGFETPP